MPSILDEQDTSLLDERDVTTGTMPVSVVRVIKSFPSSTTPSILDDTLEANKESLLSKIKETYNKAAEWASTPNPLKDVNKNDILGTNLRFTENVAKGAVGLGIGVTELAKMELGGLKEWITKPKESLMSLKQGPRLITDAVILPILNDIKELFTHPIKYTYERPVSQMLNLAMIAGIGAGVKGIQEAGKVSKATAFIEQGKELARAGEIGAGQVALDAAKGTMGTLRKEGIRALSPKLEGLAQELELQRWLKTFGPFTSRGVSQGATRKITPMNKSQQLGKWAPEVETGVVGGKGVKESFSVTDQFILKGKGDDLNVGKSIHFHQKEIDKLAIENGKIFDEGNKLYQKLSGDKMAGMDSAGGEILKQVQPYLDKRDFYANKIDNHYKAIDNLRKLPKVKGSSRESFPTNEYKSLIDTIDGNILEATYEQTSEGLKSFGRVIKKGMNKTSPHIEDQGSNLYGYQPNIIEKVLGGMREDLAKYPYNLTPKQVESLVKRFTSKDNLTNILDYAKDSGMPLEEIKDRLRRVFGNKGVSGSKTNTPPTILYHIADKEDLVSIYKQGLKASKDYILEGFGSDDFSGVNLMSDSKKTILSTTHPENKVILEIDISKLKPGQLKKYEDWYRYKGSIPPEIIKTSKISYEDVYFDKIHLKSNIGKKNKDIRKNDPLPSSEKIIPGGKLKPITLEAFNQEQAPLPLKEIGMESQMVSKINQLQEELGKQLKISSGFRTKEYNESLKLRYKNVADKSIHMEGRAADIDLTKSGLTHGQVIAAAKKVGLDVEDITLTPNHVHVELPTKGTPTKLYIFGEQKVASVFKESTGTDLDNLFGKRGLEVDNVNKLTQKEYYTKFKGLSGMVVEMSPDEYLAKIPRQEKSLSSIKYMQNQISQGKQLDMPYLDYSGKGRVSQEGRNRAYLAKEMGISKIPVLVVNNPELVKLYTSTTPLTSVTDQIRESAFANASEILPAGKLDAINYNKFLENKASGKVNKVTIKPEYLGDYYSLKPAVANLGKAIGDTPNETAAIGNHWMENLYAMKHPEHGQSFVAKNYKPQGEIPRFPERVYPWIKTQTKAPMPTGESNAFSRKVGSPGQVMRDSWGLENPLVDAFEAGQTAGINTENSFKWFRSISKGVRSDSKMVKDRMTPFVKEHISLSRKFEMTTDESMKQSLSDMIIKNYKDANDFQLKIAESSSDVRIAMYAEDTLPATMLSRISEKEIQIGEMIKSYYTKTADDMKRVGMPIVSKQAYTRHIISQEMKEAFGNYNDIPDSIKKHIPADMAFAHRAGDFNWFPSMTAQLADYIPVVERKLAFQPYLIHWKDTVDKAAKMGNKAGMEAAEMIKNNIYRGGTLSDKISAGITSTNYFLQLFMNARVAVKHVIGGFPGAVSEVGMWNTPGAVYQMVAHPLKSQEMLKTFGKLKDIVKTLEVTSGIEVRSSRLLKALQGQPTIAAEYVESGINIMGNLMKGGAKGIDPELLRSYIWNKVTSVNFRGGWDIPKVFANPAGRIAFQYSLEPHKVWEYRLELVKRAMAGERDIYGTAYGSKLIQYIAMVGASEALARAHGKTILDTIGGTPYIDFVSPQKAFPYVKGQAKVKLGPGVKLISNVSKDIARGDLLHVTDEFINYGLESGVGLLGQLSKVAGGKIPDYYEDAYDYLLGLPELDKLEKMNSKTTRYMKFRTEKDELFRERRLIQKNPILKNFVLYKRDFRKKLREFLDNPDKHFQGAYGDQTRGSILDEQE